MLECHSKHFLAYVFFDSGELLVKVLPLQISLSQSLHICRLVRQG